MLRSLSIGLQMESANLILILQGKLETADAMANACLLMIQSGQLDPASDVACACFRYLQGAPEQVRQAAIDSGSHAQKVKASPIKTEELVPIETNYDETLMLPASLRVEFTEGFRFTLEEMRICPGWRADNAKRNYCVEWAEFESNGRTGRATYESEDRIADRIAEKEKRTQLARQRANFVKQAKAELGAVSPELLAAANAVLAKNRNVLSEEGVIELQAYIGRLTGRLTYAAADLMLAGASLEDGISNAILYLIGQTEKRANALSGLGRFRGK